MTRRNTQDRRQYILEQLNTAGEVQVEQLAVSLETSEVTIRKDLAALEDAGCLVRRYGGAIALPTDMRILAPEKISKRKTAIAQTAASLVSDNHRIILDSGHTTACLTRELRHVQGLVIMTNALSIANTVVEMDNEPTLIMTGGTWDAQSEALQGQLAQQVLQSYDFDYLFIGADGIDLQRGTTTYNELYSLSRVMAEVANKVVVMAESEKIDRKIHNLELPWSIVDYLVTDAFLPHQHGEILKAQGLELLIADC